MRREIPEQIGKRERLTRPKAEEIVAGLIFLRGLLNNFDWEAVDEGREPERYEESLSRLSREVESGVELAVAAGAGATLGRLVGGGDISKSLVRGEGGFYRKLATTLVRSTGKFNPDDEERRISFLQRKIERVASRPEKRGFAPIFLARDERGVFDARKSVVGVVLLAGQKAELLDHDTMEAARALIGAQVKRVEEAMLEEEKSARDAVRDALGSDHLAKALEGVILKAQVAAVRAKVVEKEAEKDKEEKITEEEAQNLPPKKRRRWLAREFRRRRDQIGDLEDLEDESNLRQHERLLAWFVEQMRSILAEEAGQERIKEKEITVESLGLPNIVEISEKPPIRLGEGKDLIDALKWGGFGFASGSRGKATIIAQGLSTFSPELVASNQMWLGTMKFDEEGNLGPVRWWIEKMGFRLLEVPRQLFVIGDGTGEVVTLLSCFGVHDGKLAFVPVRLKRKKEESKSKFSRSEESKLIEPMVDREALVRLWAFEEGEEIIRVGGRLVPFSELARGVASQLWPAEVAFTEGLEFEDVDEKTRKWLRTLVMARIFDRFNLLMKEDEDGFKRVICDELCNPNDDLGYRSFLVRFIGDLREEVRRQEEGRFLTLPPELGHQKTDDFLRLMVRVAGNEANTQSRLGRVDFWERIADLCFYLLETSKSKTLLAKIKVKKHS